MGSSSSSDKKTPEPQQSNSPVTTDELKQILDSYLEQSKQDTKTSHNQLTNEDLAILVEKLKPLIDTTSNKPITLKEPEFEELENEDLSKYHMQAFLNKEREALQIKIKENLKKIDEVKNKVLESEISPNITARKNCNHNIKKSFESSSKNINQERNFETSEGVNSTNVHYVTGDSIFTATLGANSAELRFSPITHPNKMRQPHYNTPNVDQNFPYFHSNQFFEPYPTVPHNMAMPFIPPVPPQQGFYQGFPMQTHRHYDPRVPQHYHHYYEAMHYRPRNDQNITNEFQNNVSDGGQSTGAIPKQYPVHENQRRHGSISKNKKQSDKQTIAASSTEEKMKNIPNKMKNIPDETKYYNHDKTENFSDELRYSLDIAENISIKVENIPDKTDSPTKTESINPLDKTDEIDPNKVENSQNETGNFSNEMKNSLDKKENIPNKVKDSPDKTDSPTKKEKNDESSPNKKDNKTENSPDETENTAGGILSKPSENVTSGTIFNHSVEKKGYKPAAFSSKNDEKKINNNDFASLNLNNGTKNVTKEKISDTSNQEKLIPKKRKPKKKKKAKISQVQVGKIFENFLTVNNETKECPDMKTEQTNVTAIDEVVANNVKVKSSNTHSRDCTNKLTKTVNNLMLEEKQDDSTEDNSKISQESNKIGPSLGPPKNVAETKVKLSPSTQQHLEACQSYFDKKMSNIFKHKNEFNSKKIKSYPKDTKSHISSEELKILLPRHWQMRRDHISFSSGNLVVPLEESSSDFKCVSEIFHKSVRNKMKIVSICRLENVYTWLMFCLKKQEMAAMMRQQPYERKLFHGTRFDLTPIIENSMNWRFVEQKYKSVTFSPLASYVSHRCGRGMVRNMILARVVIGRKAVGINTDIIVPPPKINTVEKSDGKLIYKYDDHTFYPEYIITFSGHMDSQGLPTLNLLNSEDCNNPHGGPGGRQPSSRPAALFFFRSRD